MSLSREVIKKIYLEGRKIDFEAGRASIACLMQLNWTGGIRMKYHFYAKLQFEDGIYNKKENINFSQTLQSTLKEKLDI